MELQQSLCECVARALRAAGIDENLAPAIVEGAERDLPRERNLALVAADPVGIQATVLASRRFVTRTGASDTLHAWDEALRTDRRWAALYAGGGQAVLLLPASQAEQAHQRLAREYAGRHLGDLGVAVRPCSPWELVHGPEPVVGADAEALRAVGLEPGGGGFGGLLAQVLSRLRTVRDGLSRASDVAGDRCEECGARAAQKERDGHRVCTPCDAHHEARSGDADSLAFDDLGESGRLAFLAIDGTGVGARLGQERTLLGYARLSKGLLDAFDWGAVVSDLREAGVRRALPVVRGGDDLGLVFDAAEGGAAFGATLDLLEGLGGRLAPLGVGVGAGLVVTRHLGARPAMDLAGRLVRSAKRLTRQDPGAIALDFELVQSGAVLGDSLHSLRERRRREAPALPPSWERNANVLLLGRRPYALAEARQLHDLAEEIDREGQEAWGTLYRIREELDADFVYGLVCAAYALGKRRGRIDLRARLGLPAWPTAAGPPDGWLCSLGPDEDGNPAWRTAIPDLLDIHRMRRGARA